jgi:hypothetical protein
MNKRLSKKRLEKRYSLVLRQDAEAVAVSPEVFAGISHGCFSCWSRERFFPSVSVVQASRRAHSRMKSQATNIKSSIARLSCLRQEKERKVQDVARPRG